MFIWVAALENEHDRDKISEIYRLYHGTMLYIAASVLKDPHLAEDAVSEAFIKIIKHLDKIDPVDCYRTRGFIVIIVRNTALDLWRKRAKGCEREVVLEEFAIPSGCLDPVLEKITSLEACQKIADCINQLHENYSDILYLKMELDCSNKEMAKILGISRDKVKMRLYRARQALEALLAGGDKSYGR